MPTSLTHRELPHTPRAPDGDPWLATLIGQMQGKGKLLAPPLHVVWHLDSRGAVLTAWCVRLARMDARPIGVANHFGTDARRYRSPVL